MRRSLVVLLAASVLALGSLEAVHAHDVDEGAEVSHSCLVCELAADETATGPDVATGDAAVDSASASDRSDRPTLATRAASGGPRAPPALLSL